MDRRGLLLGATAGLVAWTGGRSPCMASIEPLALKWSDLVPVPAPGTAQPAQSTIAEGEVDIMEFAQRDGPIDNFHADPRDPEGVWMSRTRRTRRPPAPVVQSLDGKRVRIGGYVVPLDLDARTVKEWLLVPFVGACIHVPPPPSNQVIHVMAETAFRIRNLFDPVWVTGRLSVVQSSTELADAGYALAADSVALR